MFTDGRPLFYRQTLKYMHTDFAHNFRKFKDMKLSTPEEFGWMYYCGIM